MMKQKCPCGLPLHYSDSGIEAMVTIQCMALGPEVEVVCNGKRYMVSRHYIALHGLKAVELEELLAKGIIKEKKEIS